MNKKNDLTSQSIFKALVFLALPIMGTSFIQMAYNMTDVIWIGRLGPEATAAVGTAGFFMWFASGIIFLGRIGAEVLVAQNVGKNDMESVGAIVQNVLQLIVGFAIFFGLILLIFNKPLLDFFNLEADVTIQAQNYLKIIAVGLVFFFVNPVLSAIFNGYGKSGVPFAINTIGLVCNIVLDPLLIFGLLGMPKLGVTGAALATIISQALVTLIFIIYIYLQKEVPVFKGVKLLRTPDRIWLKKIMKIGLPVGLQSMFFTIIAMVIAKIIATWGHVPIAVQKVGSQIESISWMTASGFSTAISAFVGQNYGARKYDRIIKGYEASLLIMFIFGLFTTAVLLIFPEPIFKLFLNEPESLQEGVVYLRILGVSQLFMCIEIMTNGAFNGLGKTMVPAINSTLFNLLRIPMALILSATALSLTGVWWSITISSILKGTVIVSLFLVYLRRVKKELKAKAIAS